MLTCFRVLAVAVLSVVLATAISAWLPTGSLAAGQKGAKETDPGTEVPAEAVTVENWLEYPNSHWSFWNVDQLIPHRIISKGNSDSVDMAKELKDISGFAYQVDGKTVTVSEMLDDTYTHAFIVLHRGKIIAEEYRHNMEAEKAHLTMSVSKSVIGLLVGILVDEGKLDVSRTAGSYIARLKGTAFGNATIQQLLDMSVASDRYEMSFVGDDTVFNHLDKIAQWRGNETSSVAGSIYDFVLTARPDGKHGKRFHYFGLNTEVLAWLAETVSGKDINLLLSEKIWSRIGAEQDAFITVDRTGTGFSEGGINISARDLARLGQMLTDKGKVDGQQVVPVEWVEGLSRGGNRTVWSRGEEDFVVSIFNDIGFKKISYSNQWYSTGEAHGAFFAAGYRGQHLWVAPEKDIVIVKFSGWPEPHQTDYALINKKTMLGFNAISSLLAE